MQIRAQLEDQGPAAAIVLTDEQVASLGGTKTPAVRVTINGVTGPLRVGRMGGKNLVGFSKANRELFGVSAGDTVDAVIELDAAPREVDVPPVLAAALAKDTKAAAAFDALSFTARKEMARGIAEAKKDETRDARLAKALAQLRG